MRRWLGWIAVAAIVVFSVATWADVPGNGDGTVVLKDGTIVHGTILEVVNGDHVTIRVDGESQQLPWAAVASVLVGTVAAPLALPVSTAVPNIASSVLGVSGGDDGPLVDWPEPDRTPPNIMASRLSLGLEAGVGGVPVGSYALAAELYPWSWGFFQIGFHGAYGPDGFIGPTVSEMLTFDWSYGSTVQQGLGIGLAHSFRSTMSPVPGAPDRLDVLDADCGHFTVFITRRVLLRAMLGIQFPLTSGCDDAGKACGNPSTVYGIASLMWNFDLSRGDQ
jgi:hypothetical protein